MKDYVNFEGLSHFFNKLIDKFSAIGHTHTKLEITDLQDLMISIDTLTTDVNTLKTDVSELKSVINDNDILVANNTSS